MVKTLNMILDKLPKNRILKNLRPNFKQYSQTKQQIPNLKLLRTNFFHQKSRLSRAKYTVILFPETPNFNTVIVALKSKEIEWSVLLDSRLSLRKPVESGSNRFKILSLVLKFDVYSGTNGLGVFLRFTREKCEKVAFLFSKYLFLNFFIKNWA